MIALLELDAALAVEGAVCCCARTLGDRDAEEEAVGEDHRAEGERVWADGGEEDGRDIGVD